MLLNLSSDFIAFFFFILSRFVFTFVLFFSIIFFFDLFSLVDTFGFYSVFPFLFCFRLFLSLFFVVLCA